MTLPAFQAAGTGHESSVPWPTHASGHFGLLVVESAGGTIATPSGWTPLTSIDNSAFAVKLTVFYRFATSAAESNAALSGGTNNMWGVIVTYTGVNTSTPIYSLSQLPRGSSTGQSAPGLQTFLDDCMIVHCIAWAVDNAGPLASSPVNAGLGSLSERSDSGTVTNNGGGVIVFDGTLATFGAIGPTTFTLGSASALACVTLALQAADKTDNRTANKSRAVNTGM